MTPIPYIYLDQHRLIARVEELVSANTLMENTLMACLAGLTAPVESIILNGLALVFQTVIFRASL